MKMRKIFTYTSLLVAALFLVTATAFATTTCTFTNSGATMRLNGNCTTDASVVVPNGKTLDGRGFTITGMDPAGDHFRGAVIVNGGASATVKNLKVTVNALMNFCDSGADRLRGIMFVGASGSISGNTVTGINQGPSGCQEGNAVEIRNFGTNPDTSRVTVDGNTITGYQKTGVVANGNVDVTVSNNIVDGGGPVGYIARNGIQFGFGGTGSAKKNTVNGNGYTGSSTVSVGILIFGDTGEFCTNIQIIQNSLDNNDVGVYLSNDDNGVPPSVATNNKVVNNDISKSSVTNGYIYQAGVADEGNNDKIIANTISGAGYDPGTISGSTFDVDISLANRVKSHANK